MAKKGHVELLERQRQTVTSRLQVCLLSRPTRKKGRAPHLRRDFRQISTFVGRKKPRRDFLRCHVSAHTLDVDTDRASATERNEHQIARMGQIEVQVRVWSTGQARFAKFTVLESQVIRGPTETMTNQ
jgi:hypothetical protein